MAHTAVDSLEVARRHPQKVRAAWRNPADWADLAMYGFYCLEACVVAMALHLGQPRPRSTHQAKVALARDFAASHGLPDIEQLLIALNERRKFEAYGDVALEDDDLDAEDVANDIQGYFEAVEALVAP